MDMERTEEYQIPEDAMEKAKDPQILKRQVEEGKTLQEIFGYDEKTMLRFYQAARALFLREEWKKSADAFLFLTSLNPYVHTYWLGLGLAETFREDYHGALLALAMAILTDVKNPVPHYHSARCYLAMNEKNNAKQSLKLAIECVDESGEHLPIKVACEKLLAGINGAS